MKCCWIGDIHGQIFERIPGQGVEAVRIPIFGVGLVVWAMVRIWRRSSLVLA
jgi:hypothetical protein